MEPQKLKLLIKAFEISQFSYYTLTWTFHDRSLNKLNNEINRIHERALGMAYKDSFSSFETLLLMDNSVAIHQGNLQLLIIEICKARHDLNPSFIKQILKKGYCPTT